MARNTAADTYSPHLEPQPPDSGQARRGSRSGPEGGKRSKVTPQKVQPVVAAKGSASRAGSPKKTPRPSTARLEGYR